MTIREGTGCPETIGMSRSRDAKRSVKGYDCFGCGRSQQIDVDGSRSVVWEELSPKLCSSLDWVWKREKKMYARTVFDKAEKRARAPQSVLLASFSMNVNRISKHIVVIGWLG